MRRRRPGRSPHQALDALAVGIGTKKVKWVLDADIRDFFRDPRSRVAGRVHHFIQKWLSAGVPEDGRRTRSEVGTVQGGSVSPLLANVYLHYVFDLWIQRWRTTRARGDVVVVRYADDFVVGFEHRAEAEALLAELRERFAKFGLTLHPDKTRLIEFGRYAEHNRRGRGDDKPPTFDFLGFTHICTKTKNGHFTVLRQTMRERFRAKLKEIKLELRRRMHDSTPELGRWLGSVVAGHVRYYGVPLNSKGIGAFRFAIGRLWKRSLERRSERTRISWERMSRLIARWLPPARVCHP